MAKKLTCFLFVSLFLLSSCYEVGDNFAPVTTAWLQPKNTSVHRVRRGETLYAIAWRYDLDYRQLAKINRLRSPYALRIGQRLRLKPTAPYSVTVSTVKKSRTKQAPSIVRTKPSYKFTTRPSYQLRWRWPAKGRIVKRYSPAQGNKGVDIAGKIASPIRAAASGRVAYSGHGLRGYGNLLIIKHNGEFLSAYAHNKKNLVREGQYVKKGQIIAQMGNSQSDRVMLHFEIRKAGKPVNPLKYTKPA